MQTFAPVTLGEVIADRQFDWFGVTKACHHPNQRLHPHAHRYPALTLVRHGGFALDIDRGQVDCTRQGVFFKLGEHRHANTFGADGTEALVVELRVDARRSPDGELTLPDRSFLSRDPRLVNLSGELHREFHATDGASRLAVEGLVFEILATMLRSSRAAGRRRPDWLPRAEEMLHESFRGNVGLGDVSYAIGVHPTHVARAFRRHLGLSVGEYVRRLRTGYAASLMRDSDRRLTDIALEAGFYDQAHFSRSFKRHFGIPPSLYRQQFYRRA